LEAGPLEWLGCILGRGTMEDTGPKLGVRGIGNWDLDRAVSALFVEKYLFVGVLHCRLGPCKTVSGARGCLIRAHNLLKGRIMMKRRRLPSNYRAGASSNRFKDKSRL